MLEVGCQTHAGRHHSRRVAVTVAVDIVKIISGFRDTRASIETLSRRRRLRHVDDADTAEPTLSKSSARLFIGVIGVRNMHQTAGPEPRRTGEYGGNWDEN
jgi:hypothetical protein